MNLFGDINWKKVINKKIANTVFSGVVLIFCLLVLLLEPQWNQLGKEFFGVGRISHDVFLRLGISSWFVNFLKILD